ncbi:scavenger receptor cysteine-rich type 1 protein M130-like [Periophthalmus magnuspinnatus]|uniref:scavenger receptor cysteine-rich type 1 protein M130-like n=1 Tax=Periophthalmus magnuspinnatus TaxID=409849 RepID=UPI0024368DD7|nr:scavenger receptor cysteine-rich type 1 protein M130-like [Periophthalmus magnuspinnatus]
MSLLLHRITVKRLILELLCCIFLLANEIHSRRGWSLYPSKPIDKFMTITKEDIRMQGTQNCSGFVQVKSNGSWMDICESTFTEKNGFVACRELGCGFLLRFFSEDTDSDSIRSEFQCSGLEEHLRDCPSTPLDTGTTCRSIFLVCGEKPAPPEVTVYPIQSSNVYVGHPYVVKCHVNAPYKVRSFVLWIRDDDDNETTFTLPAEDNTAHFFMPPIMAATLQMHWCLYDFEIYPNTFCSDRRKYVYIEESSYVRLVGTKSRCLGTLELEHMQNWRPVSQQMWGLKEAAVVCRQLGCGSVLHTHTQSSVNERQPVWSFYSDCEGSEGALLSCGSVREGMSASTVHVFCSGLLLPAVISVESRNRTGEDPVLVLSPYTFYINCSVSPQYPGGHFSLVFTGDKTNHTQNQTAVNHTAIFRFDSTEKSHSGIYRCIYHNTVSGHHVSSQSHELSLVVEDAEDIVLDDGLVQDTGRTVCSGRLFVKEGGSQMMIAAENNNWDMRHASIVCRQLGCGNAVSTSKIKLPKVIPMWSFFSDCDGAEAALLQCGVVLPWFSSTAIEVVCAA